jgi:hypothetical protein
VVKSFAVHDEQGSTGPLKLGELRRFTIDSAYQAAPGAHQQQVDVIDPGGTLYGNVRAQVTAGSDGSATARQVVEVRGTTIEQYQMTGAWQFVLAVDGVPLASVTVDVVK